MVRRPGAPAQQRLRSQVFALEIEKVESVIGEIAATGARKLAPPRVEIGDATFVLTNRFTVEHRMTRWYGLRRACDGGKFVGPVVPASLVDNHLPVSDVDLCAVTICFDLVDSLAAGRRGSAVSVGWHGSMNPG